MVWLLQVDEALWLLDVDVDGESGIEEGVLDVHLVNLKIKDHGEGEQLMTSENVLL